MLTVEEDGPVNLLFLWAWLGSCALLARVRALSAWSSPASASSHIWQARWLISQKRVQSDGGNAARVACSKILYLFMFAKLVTSFMGDIK